MMEISHSMETSELPTQDRNSKSITPELNHKNRLSMASDIIVQNGDTISKSIDDMDANSLDDISADESDVLLLDDSNDNVKNESSSKPSNGCDDPERDTGSDLDALLHKISTIVDCQPKKTTDGVQPDETLKADSKKLKVDRVEDAASDNCENDKATEENQEAQSHNDESVENMKDVEGDPTKLLAELDEELDFIDGKDSENADIQEVEHKIEEVEKSVVNAKDIESEECKIKPIKIDDILDDAKVDDKDKMIKKDIEKSSQSAKSSDTEGNSVQLNNSKDDVFMDALESISSSSDDFENLEKGHEKTVQTIEDPAKKTSHKDKILNDLETISSDSSVDLNDQQSDKPNITYIDLDSSDGFLETKNTSENVANENDSFSEKNMEIEKTLTETSSCEKEADVHLATGMDLTDDIETGKSTSNEQELIDVAKSCENYPTAEQVEQIKDDKSQSEVLIIENDDVNETNIHEQKEETSETKLSENVAEKTDEEAGIQIAKADPVTPITDINKSEEVLKDQESDDEVIFFEPLENAKDSASAAEVERVESNKDNETSESKGDGGEVVLLSEDEDDTEIGTESDEAHKKSLESKKHAEKESLLKAADTSADEAVKDLLIDNSDNACDQFGKQKSSEIAKVNATDDTNSNSSSNLLRPSEKPIAQTAVPPVEDVDTVDPETVRDADEDHDSSLPPLKRVRLSVEDDNIVAPNKTIEGSISANENEEQKQQPFEPTITKRTHASLESSPISEATPSKKIKADESDSSCSNDGALQIDLDAHDNTDESDCPKSTVVDSKEEIEPLQLKPKPEIKGNVPPLRLDFLKNFRKSFDKMTRDDLEEFVLQKVLEAMLVKSEFSDLRRQVEKYEVTVSTYRRKIAELSKQFLDLDIVHKRVLKDLETKNSQFTAPVRITRAVGLQVGMSVKKPGEEMRALGAAIVHTAGSITSLPTPASLSPKIGSSPKQSTPVNRSPLRGVVPSASSGATTRPGPQSSSNSIRNALPFGSNATNNSMPGRRGCVQKVTPQRPMTLPVRQSPTAAQRLPTAQLSSPAMGKPTPYSKSNNGSPPTNASAAIAMRLRTIAGNSSPNKDHHQAYAAQKGQQQKSPQQQQFNAQQRPNAVNIASKVRPMPAGGTVSVPMSNSVAASYGQPTLAPAKPKEKAVIDLTDEDDAAAAAAAAAAVAAAEATARLRQTANLIVKRTVPTTSSNSVRPVAGSVVRVSPMGIPRSTAVSRQIINTNSNAPRQSTGSNVTMQIRSENTPPTAGRLRYSHPAPLPTSPAQPFNPAWKLPPSRPVIRISLHDTGIVISWTLEDTSTRFSSCVTYQIYAYQETINEPSTDSWRHVGDVKAMLLPMAVTLNQFQENQRYYFAVRGVDDHQRYGAFSAPKTWT